MQTECFCLQHLLFSVVTRNWGFWTHEGNSKGIRDGKVRKSTSWGLYICFPSVQALLLFLFKLWTAKEKTQNQNWMKLAGNQRKEWRTLVLKDKISNSRTQKINPERNRNLFPKSIKLQDEKVLSKHEKSTQTGFLAHCRCTMGLLCSSLGAGLGDVSFWAWSDSFIPLLLKIPRTWRKLYQCTWRGQAAAAPCHHSQPVWDEQSQLWVCCPSGSRCIPGRVHKSLGLPWKERSCCGF